MDYIFKNISVDQCVDGRELSATDDRVLALMLLYPEKWRDLLPEIYNYYDNIFYRMVTSILGLEFKAKYSKFSGVINREKVRYEWDYLLEQILIFSDEFSIQDIILSQNIRYHSTTYDFLVNREIMIAFSELFPEKWQDYWLEYYSEMYVDYYDALLYAHFLKNEEEKKKVRKRSKEHYLEDLVEEYGYTPF